MKWKIKKIIPVEFSRGCPHKCIYCSIPKLYSNYKINDIEKLLHIIEYNYKNFDIRIFDFEDDNLTFNRKTFMEFLNEIIKRFVAYDFEFKAMNGLDASTLDYELLALMKKAKFNELNLPLITINKEYKNNLKRPFDSSHYKEVVRVAKELGFKVTGYQILGMPDQKLSEMIETFSFLRDLKIKTAMSVFYPIPGTFFYEECIKRSLIPREDNELFLRSSTLPIETEEFTRENIYTFLLASRIMNFFKENKDEVQEKFGTYLMDRWHKEKKLYALTSKNFENLDTSNKIEMSISKNILEKLL